MAVTINGTTGIQNPLGSAAAPAESNTSNSNTGAYFPSSTSYAISTNGVTAVTFNETQAVGFGSSPSYGTSGQVLTSSGSGAAPTWGSSTAQGFVTMATGASQPPGAFFPADSFALI